MRVLKGVEFIIVIFGLSYICFVTYINGEMVEIFSRFNVLIPFCIIWPCLCLISFGSKKFVKIILSPIILLSERKDYYVGSKVMSDAIWLSYVTGILWCLYTLISAPFDENFSQWKWLISYCSTSLFYSFILSEFVLRPVKFRADMWTIKNPTK